jgi:hypothetical protein
VFANLIGVLSLETAQFDFDGITDLQNNSPFLSWTWIFAWCAQANIFF